MFFMTIGLGLIHGLIFLPVVLSLIGPPALPSAAIELLRLGGESETEEFKDDYESESEDSESVKDSGAS